MLDIGTLIFKSIQVIEYIKKILQCNATMSKDLIVDYPILNTFFHCIIWKMSNQNGYLK